METAQNNGQGHPPLESGAAPSPEYPSRQQQSSSNAPHGPSMTLPAGQASTPNEKTRLSTTATAPVNSPQGYYHLPHFGSAPSSTGKSPGPSMMPSPGVLPPIPPPQPHHAHFYPYGGPPYHALPSHHPSNLPQPLQNNMLQKPVGSTPTKVKASPPNSMASPIGSSDGGLAPSPLRNTGGNAGTTANNSTAGNAAAYGWHPGASPPVYHHHPHHPMPPHAAPYHHPSAYGGSPDSHWNKSVGGGATQQQIQQHPLPQLPAQGYGWPPTHHPYPYHPHHAQYPGGRYPTVPPSGMYPWAPQQTATFGSNNHHHHRNTQHPPLAPRSSTKVNHTNSNKSPGSATKFKPAITSRFELTTDFESRDGATSPSEIETHHRDEVQYMGCTCKKTRCLKLYCQCFGVKLYCGVNCRCLTCHNSRKYEKQRKEAMRNILSRNPAAFDTKFKKDSTASVVASAATTASAAPLVEQPTKEVAVSVVVNNTSSNESLSDANRVLAHKLGCKCRKSACMKKYCECYAGNVKCSPSCRCTGCKNTGSSADFRGNPPSSGVAVGLAPAAHAAHATPYNIPSQHHHSYMRSIQLQHERMIRAAGDPWIAAQSLTFLKRSSPANDPKNMSVPPGPYSMGVSPITKSPADAEFALMPSLASSSEGTSPGDVAQHHQKGAVSTPESLIDKAGDDTALLMAAVAMTEFGQSPPPTSQMLSPETLCTYAYNSETSTTAGYNNPGNSRSDPFTNEQSETDVNASKRTINFDEAASEFTETKRARPWKI